MISTETPTLLDCNKEVFIWVTYFNGVIMAGTGTETGQNVVITLPNSANVDVKALGFMAGAGSQAQVRLLHNRVGGKFLKKEKISPQSLIRQNATVH